MIETRPYKVICAECGDVVEFNFNLDTEEIKIKPCKFCKYDNLEQAYEWGYEHGLDGEWMGIDWCLKGKRGSNNG